MRYLILGAGAVGGAIGGRLFQQGHDVVLIARGEHLSALTHNGLELRDPLATAVVRIPAVGSVSDAAPEPSDVVILATKTQHSEAALADLAAACPPPPEPQFAVVCAQNGVENERMALRRLANVYGMRVMVAGTHLQPGVVEIATAPVSGVLDVGRYPSGTDKTAETIAGDLGAAGFDAVSTPDVMASKYLKLTANVANALEAACGTREGEPVAAELTKRAREEARAVYAAAGIAVADEAGEQDRRRARGLLQPVGGVERTGGSSWQSLERGTGNIEADWLNGEIVLLGRLHGIPTPVNARLQHVANKMARDGIAAGSIPADELAAGIL
jgi:2-dehydropantoate 2-reductase